MLKSILLWVVIALVMMMVFQNFGVRPNDTTIPYSQFILDVKTGKVLSVMIEGNTISGNLADGTRFNTYSPETSNDALIGTLLDNNVEVLGSEAQQEFVLGPRLYLLVPYPVVTGNLDLLHAPDAGRRQRPGRVVVRQEPCAPVK